jgi:LPS-assembly protein
VYDINATSGADPALINNANPTRFMPAVGVEASWPVMISNGGSTHVIEPVAQLIVRPDEPDAGSLPNDDAQSLVFDTTNLFDYDKFSGYDRIEGGTRLNAGIRYTGTLANGTTIGAIFGQSFQLAGENSFAQADVANTGAFSGLQSANSDYVGSVSYDAGTFPRITASGRFDHESFALERGELAASGTVSGITASANYLYLRQDPNAGVDGPASVIGGTASIDVRENLRLFGSFAVDLAHTDFSRDSVGMAYDNSCVTFTVAYSESHGTDLPNRTLTFNLLLRTLGGSSVSTNLGAVN